MCSCSKTLIILQLCCYKNKTEIIMKDIKKRNAANKQQTKLESHTKSIPLDIKDAAHERQEVSKVLPTPLLLTDTANVI